MTFFVYRKQTGSYSFTIAIEYDWREIGCALKISHVIWRIY